MIAAAFVVFAALAALARWQLAARLPLPIGTLVANLAGSFGLGLLAGAGDSTQTIVGVAGLGTFTTFSTVIIELVELWRRARRRAVLYAAVTMVLGVAAALLGVMLS